MSPDKHAKLSPSAANRWLTCTAAPTLEAEYPSETSVFAQEGTFAHKIAELCAGYAIGDVTKTSYTRALNKLKQNELFSQEMLDYCEEYSSYVKEKLFELRNTCPDAFAELEVNLDLSRYIPEGFGTADCIIIAEPDMWVIDFKYGKGVKVDAARNVQMEIYALGAIEKYKSLFDIQNVNLAIVQPRLGGISEFSIGKEQLDAWATIQIIPQAKEAYEGPGHFHPSEDACRFCKAAKDCRARAEYFVKLFDENSDNPRLSIDEIGALLEKAQGISDWINDLTEKVTEALFDGTPVTGWKLVEGKSNRKWSDEDAVADVLKKSGMEEDQIYKKKLIGITDVEKQLGKKDCAEKLSHLIIKPAGKPTLAPFDDKRPEVFPAKEIIDSFDKE